MPSRRTRRAPFGIGRARLIRLLIAGAIGIVLAWLVVTVGIAAATRDTRPELALQVRPHDAHALERRAEQLVIDPKPSLQRLREGEALARAALSRDGTDAGAWRTLALVHGAAAPGAPTGSGLRLLGISEQLSRRDMATQLALIEAEVARGNVTGALIHYDIALRVSPGTDPLLLPILVRGAGDPNVREPLARMLVRAPAWRRRFFSTMASMAVPPDTYVGLLTTMRRYGPLAEADIFRGSAGSYAEGGQADAAWRIATLLDGRARWAAPLRNGDFRASGTTPPLDWAYDQGGTVEGVPGAAGGPGRLTITSANGDAGRAAHQLLRLQPGRRYQLGFRAGPVPGSDPAILYAAVHCGAVSGPPPIGEAAVTASRPAVGRVAFTVPADCTVQWLELGARLGRSDTANAGWITDIAITPAG